VALDLRDRETEGHTQRVTQLAIHLARELGCSEEELVHIRRGALLHDMGKMGIPDEILQKPGPLTAEEWVIMRKHPLYAYQMLSPIRYLNQALIIPYYHHERWDGSGYPHGLKGDEIPLFARLFAVVDVWDALSSDRPYRKRLPPKEVVQYLEQEAGRLFDPEIVKRFLPLIRIV
jgi:putative nucleotidyltransferase with HDIG domain